MSRLIFVTTELHPETAGGAGVAVDALARRLGEERECVVILATSEPVATVERPGVELIQRHIPADGFLKRAEEIAKAVADVAVPGDRVEFHDFEGIAYLTLAHRVDLGLDRACLTVRFHGPYDLLIEAMDTVPSDWELPAAMEREVFKMADAVLIPVPGHLAVMLSRYGLEPERVVLSPPPITPLSPLEPRTPDLPTFAVLGRLGEMKGSQDMVNAALLLMERGASIRVRFIGGDGWSPTNGTPMTEWLKSSIPERHRYHFEFVGYVDRSSIGDHLGDVTAVVVSSRFESFCLAAHESRLLGLPVIVPDLPAFRGLFEDHGALFFDGSVERLASAVGALASDPALVRRLAAEPAPETGSTWSAYAADPSPRHPRSQAGLATAATQRVNALWEESKQRNRPHPLQGVYRRLPSGVARVLRLAPRSLKDRVRPYASWPAEEARRAREQRMSTLAGRIEAGEFPDLDDPDVTVVVPVHDDVEFLEETIASVYEQTHPSWEIVVVDDGSSSEDALLILDRLERPRLRLVRQSNQGLAAARNAGMSLARGRYLVPLDSDDELEPEFLSTLIPALDAHPQAAYAHCYARLYHDVEAFWVTRPFNPYWQLLGNGVVGCVLMRREAWESVGGYDPTMTSGNEDWELWLRFMEKKWGQVQVPKPLFKYRKHGISMSVDTEARFEQGRRMVRDRHPGLYEPERMRRFKRRWYPLLTAITNITEPFDDDIEIALDLAALTTTWGKYVVDLRGVDPMPIALLLNMADALEKEPKAARAVTAGLPPLILYRRWNLHDPGAAPDQVVILDEEFVAPESVMPAHVNRPGWAVPPDLADGDIPVQRQPPEEEGSLPEPSQW